MNTDTILSKISSLLEINNNKLATDLLDLITSKLDSFMSNIMVKYITPLFNKNNDLECKIANLETRLANLEIKNLSLQKHCDEIHEENVHLKQISHNHQAFLEKSDADSRKSNLIIKGLSESSNLNGESSDENKCLHIFNVIKADEIKIGDFTTERIGDKNYYDKKNLSRPLMLKFKSFKSKQDIFMKRKNLKPNGGPYKKIFINKDIHPIVAKEWGRLNAAYKKAKETPENIGHNIVFDKKNRSIVRDGMTIVDKWRCPFL